MTFTATASDAGNTSACSAPFTYTEDSTAPQTTIDTGPSGTSSNNDPSFSYSSDEPGSSFECRLDGPGPTTGSFADCTPSPRAYTDLADGAYTFSVRATDAAGNVDASPDTRAFSVETTVDNPPVAVSDTATVAEDSGATSINVRANDTDIDGGPKTVLSVTQPAHGAVAITGGGTELTYQPNANYCNGGSPTDNFTYTLNGGSTANVSVTVTCVDDAPVAVNDTATVSRNSGPTRSTYAPTTPTSTPARRGSSRLPSRPMARGDHRRRLLAYLPAEPQLLQRWLPARRLHLHPQRWLDRERGGGRELRDHGHFPRRRDHGHSRRRRDQLRRRQ